LAAAAVIPLRSEPVVTVSRDRSWIDPAVMSEREPDFEFDFFEEPETREAQGRDRTLRRPLGGGGPTEPRGPRRPLRPAAGLAPLLRLIGLIAFAILIVVLLVLWVQSCQEADRRDAYRDYMGDVTQVATESERVGRRLNDVLTTQAIQPAELDTQLTGLVQQQTIGVERALGLDPPGPLRAAHADLVKALELRVNGLDGLATAFRRTRGTDDAPAAGALLVPQAQRLVASDVIWEDLFKTPSMAELREQDVTGVEVPDSNFVQTADLASTRTIVPIWQRINGKPTSGGGTGAGLHGTGISAVTVLPAGTQLSPSAENTIVASTDLAFRVAVENTGDNQEVEIEVTLTIQQTPTPVAKTQTINIINPGEVKNVVFRDFPSIDFGEPRTLRVDVAPVPQEAVTDNNSQEYRVIFSFE
jgi:CARDB